MNIEAYVCFSLTALLAVFVGCLLFGEKFRADIMGKGASDRGKVIFLGVTAEGGVLILVLIALIVAVLYTAGEAAKASAAYDRTSEKMISLDRLPYEPKPTSVDAGLSLIAEEQIGRAHV